MICPQCRAQYSDFQVCPADGTQLIAPPLPVALVDGEPSATVETTLLQTLRGDPADLATRQVYADWLEQHGYETRASFLRLDAVDDLVRDDHALHELALPTDAAWRTIISRAPIAKCVSFAFVCPKRWDALTPTKTDGVRHCGACNKPVYFCSTVAEAHARGANRECVAVDAALTRSEVETAYDAATRAPMNIAGLPVFPPQHEVMMGAMLPPPPQPKPGVLARIKGWFGR